MRLLVLDIGCLSLRVHGNRLRVAVGHLVRGRRAAVGRRVSIVGRCRIVMDSITAYLDGSVEGVVENVKVACLRAKALGDRRGAAAAQKRIGRSPRRQAGGRSATDRGAAAGSPRRTVRDGSRRRRGVTAADCPRRIVAPPRGSDSVARGTGSWCGPRDAGSRRLHVVANAVTIAVSVFEVIKREHIAVVANTIAI